MNILKKDLASCLRRFDKSLWCLKLIGKDGYLGIQEAFEWSKISKIADKYG